MPAKVNLETVNGEFVGTVLGDVNGESRQPLLPPTTEELVAMLDTANQRAEELQQQLTQMSIRVSVLQQMLTEANQHNVELSVTATTLNMKLGGS